MVEANYRRATSDDAAQISAIISELTQDPQPIALRPLTTDQVREWIERLGDQGGLFVAEVEGRIVGFGALDFNTEEPDMGTLGVWVLTSQRKRGLGTGLAECVLEHGREKSFRRIRGRLPQDNEVALSFLSSIGALVPLYNPESRFELPL